LLFPSIVEEPPLSAVLESMRMGFLSIASRAGGMPEIVKETYVERMLFTPRNLIKLIDRWKKRYRYPKIKFLIVGDEDKTYIKFVSSITKPKDKVIFMG